MGVGSRQFSHFPFTFSVVNVFSRNMFGDLFFGIWSEREGRVIMRNHDLDHDHDHLNTLQNRNIRLKNNKIIKDSKEILKLFFQFSTPTKLVQKKLLFCCSTFLFKLQI